jgi:hypothetical protein
MAWLVSTKGSYDTALSGFCEKNKTQHAWCSAYGEDLLA